MKKTPSCGSCGGHGFWRGMAGRLRRLLTPWRREDRLEHIPVDRIDSHPLQPREHVLEEPQESLTRSVERYGVIVPIIVHRQGRRYTLVAGQRRLMAARRLGLNLIPAIVRTLNAHQMVEVSALENLHRQDFSSVDMARAFDRIHRKYPGISEEDMAEAMGLSVEEIRHARGLLGLPPPALEALRAGMISEGQARIVATLEDPDVQLKVIERVYTGKIGLEETQELVNRVARRDPSYVTSEGAAHFHSASCPFALLIPEDRREGFYSRKEVARRGKIPCMQCL